MWPRSSISAGGVKTCHEVASTTILVAPVAPPVVTEDEALLTE